LAALDGDWIDWWQTVVIGSLRETRAAKDPNLKRRTLTNLYNERPTWLRLAHEKLDRAVLGAYAAVQCRMKNPGAPGPSASNGRAPGVTASREEG
jgi:hypothetical protein